MNRDNERLKIIKVEGGGELIVDCELQDKAHTAEAHRIQDRRCKRCGRSIERGPFVRVAGLIDPDAIYHRGCAVV